MPKFNKKQDNKLSSKAFLRHLDATDNAEIKNLSKLIKK
jgi:hypothetical protein